MDVALTSAMRDVLRGITRAQRPSLYSLAPGQARGAYDAAANVLDIAPAALAHVSDQVITARDGYALPARLYRATPLQAPATVLPTLLYLHGGGFTVGSIASHDVLCRQLCHLADCAVLSLGYRLAPEYKFPTALHDSWDALQWLARQGQAWGLDTSRLAIGGDSAGGTLATVCALQARDAGLPLALQLLFYPGCAAYPHTPSQHKFAQGYVLDAPTLEWFFAQYLNSPAEREDWRFAPLDGQDAPDCTGVASLWLGLAECDPLLDEGLLYADKLRAAGVAVDLEIYRGVTHEFIKMGRVIPEARQAHADAAQALRRAWQSV